MDEAQAINLLIQSVHKGQAKGAFELMEAYTLAAAVETATKVMNRLQEEAQVKNKANILAEAAIKDATPDVNGEEKSGHESPGAPQLLNEIVVDEKKDKKKDEKKK